MSGRFRTLGSRLGTLLAAMQLGACATLMKPVDDADRAWEQRQKQLEQIDQFTLNARVASGGIFGIKGNLIWRQRDEEFDMSVAGPFGVGAVKLSGTPQLVTVTSKSGSSVTPDPERYLHDRLGWTFPVEGLRYWVLGLPSPFTDAEIQVNDSGLLEALDQDQWALSFDEYQTAGRWQLPRKFVAENSEVKIKIVIDQWSDLP